jgi:hypothetical protein
VQKLAAGALGLSGALARRTSKLAGGTLTPAGALGVIKTAVLSIGGTLAPSGGLAKRAGKGVAGAVLFAGTVARNTAKTFTGAVGLAGAPDSYFDQIVHRNQLRKWGLTTKVLDKLGQQLANCTLTHNGLLPVSVELWLGRDLAYNWQEQMLWLADGVRELGYE